jgi:hypothetical protein
VPVGVDADRVHDRDVDDAAALADLPGEVSASTHT